MKPSCYDNQMSYVFCISHRWQRILEKKIIKLCPFLGRDQRLSWKEEPSCPLHASGLQTAAGKAWFIHPRGRGTLSGCFGKCKGWLREEMALCQGVCRMAAWLYGWPFPGFALQWGPLAAFQQEVHILEGCGLQQEVANRKSRFHGLGRPELPLIPGVTQGEQPSPD